MRPSIIHARQASMNGAELSDEDLPEEPRRLSARERRKLRKNLEQYPAAPEPKTYPKKSLPPAPPETADGWQSIGSMLVQHPPSIKDPQSLDSLPIMEARPNPQTVKERKPPNKPNATVLLRRILAADLVLDKPIHKLDLGA